MKRISIVIPFYNSIKILDRCLGSCLKQSIYPIPIICVNDGSKDDTKEKLIEYKRRYDSIKLINKKNGGICSARNVGINHVDTEYVAFLDHDDVLHRNKLKHQLRLLHGADPAVGFVASSYIDVLGEKGGQKKVRRVYTRDKWVALIHARLGRTSSNLWRTDDVRAAGGWCASEGLSLDTGLMFRLMKRGVRPLMDDVVHTTRYVTASSASQKDRITQWSTFFDMRIAILHYLQSANLLTPEREEALCIDLISALRGLFANDSGIASRKSKMLPLSRSVISQYRVGPGRLYKYLYRYFGLVGAERVYAAWLAMRNPTGRE